MVVYDSGDSDNLIQALTSNLTYAKEIFTRLSKASAHLIEVINSGALSGAAYEAGKELFVAYINPMLQKLAQAISDIENDLNAYKSADNMVRQYESHLDSDQINQQLNNVKELIRLVQQKIDDDKNYIQDFMKGGFQGVANALGEIVDLQEQLGNLEQVKSMYEQQLAALETFVSSTAPLFTDSLQAFKYAMQGVAAINQSRASVDGTITWAAGADMSWATNLIGEQFSSTLNFDSTTSKLSTKGMSSKDKAAYDASVSQALTQLEEQGWTSSALKAYVDYLNKVAGKYKGSDIGKYMLGVVPATGSILSLFDGSGIKSADDVNANVQTLSDIFKGASSAPKTGGRSDIWEKTGTYDDAKSDFDSLQPQDVKSFKMKNGGEGLSGKLLDGRQVSVRTGSTDTRPTLQIEKSTDKNNPEHLKIRYGEKASDTPEVPKIPDISEEGGITQVPDIPDEPIKPDSPVIPDEPVDPDLPLFP